MTLGHLGRPDRIRSVSPRVQAGETAARLADGQPLLEPCDHVGLSFATAGCNLGRRYARRVHRESGDRACGAPGRFSSARIGGVSNTRYAMIRSPCGGRWSKSTDSPLTSTRSTSVWGMPAASTTSLTVWCGRKGGAAPCTARRASRSRSARRRRRGGRSFRVFDEQRHRRGEPVQRVAAPDRADLPGGEETGERNAAE
jgi:hypothetical protein